MLIANHPRTEQNHLRREARSAILSMFTQVIGGTIDLSVLCDGLNSYDSCEMVATRRFAKLEKQEDITGSGEAIVLGIQELL